MKVLKIKTVYRNLDNVFKTQYLQLGLSVRIKNVLKTM